MLIEPPPPPAPLTFHPAAPHAPGDVHQLAGRVRDQRRVEGGLRLRGRRQHSAVAVEVACDQRLPGLVGELSEPFQPWRRRSFVGERRDDLLVHGGRVVGGPVGDVGQALVERRPERRRHGHWPSDRIGVADDVDEVGPAVRGRQLVLDARLASEPLDLRPVRGGGKGSRRADVAARRHRARRSHRRRRRRTFRATRREAPRRSPAAARRRGRSGPLHGRLRRPADAPAAPIPS